MEGSTHWWSDGNECFDYLRVCCSSVLSYLFLLSVSWTDLGQVSILSFYHLHFGSLSFIVGLEGILYILVQTRGQSLLFACAWPISHCLSTHQIWTKSKLPSLWELWLPVWMPHTMSGHQRHNNWILSFFSYLSPLSMCEHYQGLSRVF